jgi:hypothetical protein
MLHPSRPLPKAPLRPLAFAVLLAVLVLSGCDLPTQIPRYDTSWSVVAVSDSIATADLLPKDVIATPQGFQMDAFSLVSDVRLKDVCELCTCLSGEIPAFQLKPHDWPLSMPPGVSRATLAKGRASIVIYNELGFDLLDDGAGGLGFIVVDLTDTKDRSVLDQAVVNGPFPPGDSVRLSFDLSGLVLSPELVATVYGYMPGSGCQKVKLEPESGFRVRVELEKVLASSVEVWAGDSSLRIPERDFVIPDFIAKRLRSGEAELALDVEVRTRIPADVEIGMSAAGRREDLFSGRAALYTPLLIPGGTLATASAVTKTYLVQLDPLTGASRVYLDTRNRFLKPGPLVLRGGESVSYQVRLRAQVPTR